MVKNGQRSTISLKCICHTVHNNSAYAVEKPVVHGITTFIDNKAKFRHLKNLTCEGTLRQVYYRLGIQSVMLVFSTQLCELLPLYTSLWYPSLRE
jgi:hypothetical protein